ncbi:hypothetical protein P9Z84_30415 [Bacillus cereus]|uniref:hypothetical protein n=1 Tax=Bacillus sp. SH8-8 TaxID=2217830 RepID=UPI002DB63708|nr:hypothetical protein [Bacillus cereus]
MKVGPIVAITFLVCLMALYQLPKMNHYPKKDKIVFVSLTAMGWILTILLVHFPDIPGPNKLIQVIFEPFEKMLPK